MKTLISFAGFLMISLFCPEISLGRTRNLERFRQVVIFADSLSDNGNTFAQNGTPPPPYFEGRWTNGYNWVDYFPGVARHFTPITAFLKNRGSNFATGDATSASLSTQIKTFLANFTASPDSLYIIWIGANDFAAGSSPTATVQNIYDGIMQLLTAGARHIMILNIPDISLTPTVIARGGPTVLAAEQFVNAANNLLTVEVHLAASIYPVNADIVDINSLFVDLLQTRPPSDSKTSFKEPLIPIREQLFPIRMIFSSGMDFIQQRTLTSSPPSSSIALLFPKSHCLKAPDRPLAKIDFWSPVGLN